MDAGINKELVERLYSIPWFQNCGEDIPHLGLKVSSKDEVIKRNSSIKWGNTVLDFQGDLTVKLSKRQIAREGDEYNLWNGMVNEWKSTYLSKLDDVWTTKLEEKELNTKEIINMVRFCVLHIVMADAYRSIVPVDAFSENLLKIYESGHLPCGWSGKKDKGTFYIY